MTLIIEKQYVHKTLLWIARADTSIRRLGQLRAGRKNDQMRDALWDGQWEIKRNLEDKPIPLLMHEGGLLHYGMPAAMMWAASNSPVQEVL